MLNTLTLCEALIPLINITKIDPKLGKNSVT